MTNDKLDRLLTFLLDSVQSTKDFVLAQAPDILQQLITFESIKTGAISIILLLVSSALIWIFCVCFKNVDKDESGEIIMPMIFSAIGFITSSCFLIYYSLNFVKILVAPKVYILEYINCLINRG